MDIYKHCHIEEENGGTIDTCNNGEIGCRVISLKEYFELCGLTEYELKLKNIYRDKGDNKLFFDFRDRHFNKYWDKSEKEFDNILIIFLSFLYSIISGVISGYIVGLTIG